ncbi:MAG: M48 family metalloprotease [Acidiferrobacterales bacterium]|nr:M48 family metalloprotease [Acidiferrobacterales bacterium]
MYNPSLRFSRVFFLFILFAFLSACATNPVTGKRQLALSESWELSAGAQYHEQILQQYQVYDDTELQAYVNDIGQRLAAKSHRSDLKWTFTLLDSPEVNAFALPGGFTYITRGIMAYMNKEAHLAGVIGHEIGHVTARHGAQRAAQQQVAGVGAIGVAILTGSSELAQASQMLGGALMSGYGREQELESDRLGAEYIAQNNYDVDEMLGVISILKNQELFAADKARAEGREPQAYHGLFSTHPDNDKRLQEVIKAAEKFRDTSEPIADDGKFLRLTNGMTFGESESQGITRGNKFYHKDLDLYLEFPQGWRVVNQPTQVLAISPDSSQAIAMRMDSTQAANPGAYLNSKFQPLSNQQNVDTGFGQAAAAVATLTDESTGQQQNVRVSAIPRGQQTYLIVGQGKSTLPNQDFFSVVKSMRGLKNSEQSLASGNRIELVTAQRGDTFAKLAQQTNIGDYAEAQLRLINNMYPSGEPTPGQLIKVLR